MKKKILSVVLFSITVFQFQSSFAATECVSDMGSADISIFITNSTDHPLFLEYFTDYRERDATKKYIPMSVPISYDYTDNNFFLGSASQRDEHQIMTAPLYANSTIKAGGKIPTCGWGSPAGMGFRIMGLDGVTLYAQTGGADGHPAPYGNGGMANTYHMSASCSGGGGPNLSIFVPKSDDDKKYAACSSGTQVGPLCITMESQNSCWNANTTYRITVQKQVDDQTLNYFRTQMN